MNNVNEKGHSICFRCLENLEGQAKKKAADRTTELEVENAELKSRLQSIKEGE